MANLNYLKSEKDFRCIVDHKLNMSLQWEEAALTANTILDSINRGNNDGIMRSYCSLFNSALIWNSNVSSFRRRKISWNAWIHMVEKGGVEIL